MFRYAMVDMRWHCHLTFDECICSCFALWMGDTAISVSAACTVLVAIRKSYFRKSTIWGYPLNPPWNSVRSSHGWCFSWCVDTPRGAGEPPGLSRAAGSLQGWDHRWVWTTRRRIGQGAPKTAHFSDWTNWFLVAWCVFSNSWTMLPQLYSNVYSMLSLLF